MNLNESICKTDDLLLIPDINAGLGEAAFMHSEFCFLTSEGTKKKAAVMNTYDVCKLPLVV